MNAEDLLPSQPLPRISTMPLQHHTTLEDYSQEDLASGAEEDPSLAQAVQLEDLVTAGPVGDTFTHKPEIKQAVGGSVQSNASTNKLKKKLARTDSSVMVTTTNGGNGNEETMVVGLRGKPPPSPPVLVQNAYVGTPRSLSATRQNTVDHTGNTGMSINTGSRNVHSRGHQGKLSTSNYSSCPNLIEDIDIGKSKIRPSKSSDGRLCKTAPSPSRSARTSPSLLTVPNFFTTSYTHSKPVNRIVEKVRTGRTGLPPRGKIERHMSLDSSSSSEGSGPASPSGEAISEADPNCSSDRRTYRHSAPELVSDPAELTELQEMREKCSLTKSLSDTPYQTHEQLHEPVSRQRSQPRISQIVDYLCIGNLEAAHNERLLCKNQISSVLDLSNILPEDVPPSRKNIAPCTCGSAQKHMRAVLRLSMRESDLVEVKSHFPKINKFIEGARSNKKKVLIYCDSANNNLSILVTAQYLMHHRNMNFRKAYSQIMKGRSDIELNQAYYALLQSLENQIYPEQEEVEFCPTYEPTASLRRGSSGLLPREAWTDSSET